MLQDNAKIALPETGTPVELDRIYQSLSDLTQALGPNGANKNGALDDLLDGGTKALRGNGKLGNETLLNLSAAVQTFGDSSGPLFDSVKNMSQLTDTLAANDRFVDGFMADLTSVSTPAGGATAATWRRRWPRWPAPSARSARFVHDNKGMVEKDVSELTGSSASSPATRTTLNTWPASGALGLDNLTIAYDNKTRSIGSRIRPRSERRQPRQHALRHHRTTPASSR